MFANSIQILTLNTNNASPIATESDSGTQPVNKVLNSSNHDESCGSRAGSGLSNKTNKRDQKHNNKTKFVHGNSNKMQQHLTQQHQQTHKYHHKNNSSNNSGSKLKNQHYGNINGSNHNTSTTINRKKYYQQPHQQQHQQYQQQQQYITTMHKSTNSSLTTTTITNNNNSNLVKNQNYINTDLLSHQQQYQPQQNNVVKSLENFSTNLTEACTCFLQQNNCDKLSQPSFSIDCSSSSVSVLATKTSDCLSNNICYDNLKNSSTLSDVETTAKTSNACISCWKTFAKSPQPPQPATSTNLVSNNVNDLTTNCDTNENLPKTTLSASHLPATTALSSTYKDGQSELSTNSPTSSAVPKRKPFWKSSNTSGDTAVLTETEVNRSSSSGYSSSSTNQSPKLSKEKQHHVWDKNLNTNTSRKLGKNTNQSCYEENFSAKLATSTGTNQQTNISKQKIHTVDKIAMPTSLTTSIESSTSIKTSVSSNNNSFTSKISTQSTKTQQEGSLEKPNETKQILKTLSNNINSNGDINKTTTTTNSSLSTSISSSTSSQSSYSLDFLHSVGVKMTGVSLRSPGMQGTSTNQRQPRYMYDNLNTNSGSNASQLQHYHHHHQPSQLTIASFLHKDLLGGDSTNANAISTSSNRGNSSSSNSRNTSNYQDRQQPLHYTQQQHHNTNRYHQNYNVASYQQQPAVMQHTNYGGGGGGGGYNGGHRSSGYSYTNYHNNSGENVMSKNNTMTQLHPRQLKNNIAAFKNSINSTDVNKKSTYASSTTSNGSISSSKSFSSNSSNISNRHFQSIVNQDSSNTSSNLNLAIETLPAKMLNGFNQRVSHRGHHNSHHGHHGHHHGNQHLMINTPNVLQHQNYHNLTYVTTDASACGATASRGCSPASQSLPTTPLPATNCNSPKSLDQVPGHAAMLMNFNANQFQYSRYQHAQVLAAQQQQQFLQFQQQQQANLLNKKVFVPLSLNLPSPSPSPTLISNSQQAKPHNIICCSQLDKASTAAAAAAASSSSSSGINAGMEYDSDNSSNHSTQIKYQTIKSAKSSISSSSSSSSSASSISQKPQEVQQRSYVQSATSAACTQTTPMHSPLNFNYCGTSQAISNLPQFYGNNGGGSAVISLLNLPANAQNTVSEEDYLQQQQFCLTSTPNQGSPDQHNIAVANHSNNSSGYWSPSLQNNHFIYHQFASTQTALIPSITSSSSSCGSSSASISPRLPNDYLHTDTQQKLYNSSGKVSDSLSPSSCSSSLNQHLGHIIVANSSNSDSEVILSGSSSSSSSSSVSGYVNNGSGIRINSTNGEHNSKRSSSQLLAHQSHRLTAHKNCQSSSSSASSLSSSSASTLTSAVRARNGVGGDNGIYTNNGCNSQLLPPSQAAIASFVESSISGSQNLPPTATQHFYSHHQTLPPPLPPHNLLYSNPQTHHLRALSSSSVHDFFTHTPPDRFLARAHLIEAKEAPATLLNNSKWDHLSQGIWKKFMNSQQTEETFKQKMRLWRYLYVFIKNAYPRYGLYLVGSTISGFGSDSSDVDMCLVSRSASSIEPRLEALFNLTILRDCLSKSGQFENFNLIEAKVPILRFCDRVHELEVDLNFNNCVGIKNTHLLYCYSQLDWRLRPLVLVTKLWAQYHNINNAKNMTISSYSLVLMVIHFLQYAVNPPVLPCLHDIFPDKFPLLRSNDFGYVDMNETIGPYESKNAQTIGELFLMFLEYYSFFDYTQFAISVRTGGLLPINVCRVAKSIKNDIHQWKELCIEEPFDLTNTARSVYDFETFERVKGVFVASWRILQETLDLNSVFSTILLPSPCLVENSNMHRNINSSISSATAFNNILSSVDVNDTKINYEQYIKDFRVSSPVNRDNEEHNPSSLGYNNEDSVVDVADDYTDEGDNNATATNSSLCISSTARKMRKRKDLNRTLTPRQVKVFSEKEFFCSPSSTTSSSTSIKTGSKNINLNNNTNSNRTVSAVVS